MLRMLMVYYQLTKPSTVCVNGLMIIAGVLFAMGGSVEGSLLSATLTGGCLVVAATCVLNNYIDRDVDKRMKRTQGRPLVTGELSERSALIYGVVLAIVGFLVLTLFTNFVAVIVAALAFFAYVVVYSVAKCRFTYGTLVGKCTHGVGAADWLYGT